MPRCSACEVRKEAMAQQASVIEALTRALDAVRPAVASHPVTQRGIVPQNEPFVPPGDLPGDVRQAVVTVAGFQGPLRDHLEEWATTALAFGMDEATVARMIFEGETE